MSAHVVICLGYLTIYLVLFDLLRRFWHQWNAENLLFKFELSFFQQNLTWKQWQDQMCAGKVAQFFWQNPLSCKTVKSGVPVWKWRFFGQVRFYFDHYGPWGHLGPSPGWFWLKSDDGGSHLTSCTTSGTHERPCGDIHQLFDHISGSFQLIKTFWHRLNAENLFLKFEPRFFQWNFMWK